MPLVTIPAAPIAPGRSPVEVHVREAGEGPAVVLLHGGWGYEAYPFDRAIGALAPHHRLIAPDRVGYGRSGRIPELPPGFHRLMAEETFAVMDALGVREAALWGHSDGAVIAAWAALLAPERVRAIVLEAFHFFALKASSVDFFETAVAAPERFGAAVVEACRRDHGDSWRSVIGMGGRAWLSIIQEGRRGKRDIYEGRLGEVRAPALFLHGRHDPRTEPGELEAAGRALSGSRIELLDAGHGPHTSVIAADRCISRAAEFLASTRRRGWPAGA